MRYYYKHGLNLLSLKKPINPIPEGYIEITEEEYVAEKEAKKTNNYGFTKEQLEAINAIENDIKSCKKELSETDYKAIKFFEGAISEEEFKPVKERRAFLREKINSLENNLYRIKNG